MYSSEGIIASGDFNFDDAAAVLQKAKRGMQCKVRLAPHADHRHAPHTPTPRDQHQLMRAFEPCDI